MYRIGIDIGGTNIKFAFINSNETNFDNIDFMSVAYPKGIDCIGLCRFLHSVCVQLIKNHNESMFRIEHIGIALPGSIDYAHGIVNNANNIGFNNVPIVEIMRTFIDNPNTTITILNDADAATIAEYKFGSLRGFDNACLVTLGTGVGAGIMLNGKLFCGGMSRGSEFGHMTLNIHGNTLCSCGNIGCVESLCNAGYIESRGRAVFENFVRLTAKDVFDLAKSGNAKALEIFHEYVDNLSAALASLGAIFDPMIIAIGGGISLAGDFLLQPVREKLDFLYFFSSSPKIVAAQLYERAGALGATC